MHRSRSTRAHRNARRLWPIVGLGLVLTVTACLSVAEAVRHSTGTTVAADGSALSAADGWLPDGESLPPWADVPAVTGLQPALREAVQEAATAAEGDGVEVRITSGWRSPAYQQALLDSAVLTYGSPAAARRFVLGPDRSRHVTGEAVDIGSADATDWLHRHGAAFGLCQTYANEPWHFQLATERNGDCPPPLQDAASG